MTIVKYSEGNIDNVMDLEKDKRTEELNKEASKEESELPFWMK